MRTRENTHSSSIVREGKFWSIPVPPGPLANSSIVLQCTLLSSQHNNNTANLGCAGFPSMRLARRTRPVGFGLSFVNDADVVGDAYRESMTGRQYQGLSI